MKLKLVLILLLKVKLRQNHHDIEFHESPIISNCLYISTKINVSNFDAYKEGLFEIQDFGSQLIVKLLNPKPYSLVVDFCCGAGGKALASSTMMKNTGLIYAVDISPKRIDELNKRAKRAGVTNLCPLVVSSLEDSKIENLSQKASFVLVVEVVPRL